MFTTLISSVNVVVPSIASIIGLQIWLPDFRYQYFYCKENAATCSWNWK